MDPMQKPIDLPDKDDIYCITHQSCLHLDTTHDELVEALKRCTILVHEEGFSRFYIYGRLMNKSNIARIDKADDNKYKLPYSRNIYELLGNGYDINKDSEAKSKKDCIEIEQYVRENQSVYRPMVTLRDGKHLVFWEEGQAYIDMYSDGIFGYTPSEFAVGHVAPDDEKSQGMIRYLMRMAGVEAPKGKISFNEAGMEELRKLPEFECFEYDMKTDAAKVAKPHRALDVIRVLVGGSGVGKTKRAYLLTQLFGAYGTTAGTLTKTQFDNSEHPYVVELIDEATRMNLRTQKNLEQRVTDPNVTIKRKYLHAATWPNLTMYLITANKIADEAKNFKITGPNQRWIVRGPVGTSADFAKDVGWGMIKVGKEAEKANNMWNKEALDVYLNIIAHFYDPNFWPIPSVEASKRYSNNAAYIAHVSNDDEVRLKFKIDEHIADFIEHLKEYATQERLDLFQAAYLEQRPFTATKFKEAFSFKQGFGIIGRILVRFTEDTGIKIINGNGNRNNYVVEDWDKFLIAMKNPYDKHVRKISDEQTANNVSLS